MVINDSELELRSDHVDVKTAEEQVKSGATALYYHLLTQEEEDLVLGVYCIEMSTFLFIFFSKERSSNNNIIKTS